MLCRHLGVHRTSRPFGQLSRVVSSIVLRPAAAGDIRARDRGGAWLVFAPLRCAAGDPISDFFGCAAESRCHRLRLRRSWGVGWGGKEIRGSEADFGRRAWTDDHAAKPDWDMLVDRSALGIGWSGTRDLRRSESTHMDDGAVLRIRDGAPEHLMRNGSDVSAAEDHEAEEIQNGISLGPAEVGVGNMSGGLLQMNQECGYGIGDHRTGRPQHTIIAYPA